MRVLEGSGREDVLEFLGMEKKSPKARGRSGSKTKFGNRLRNIHAIDNDA